MTTNFKDVNTGASVIIDSKTRQHYRKDYNNNTVIISTLCSKIYNELLKKFQESHFEPISLNMKHYGTIVVKAMAIEDINTLEDCELFEINNNIHPYLNSESLIAIAGMIANWDHLYNEAQEKRERCKLFYEENIKGHSKEMLELGNEIALALDDQEKRHHVNRLIERFYNDNKEHLKNALIEKFQNETGLTPEQIRTALTLSKNWNIYGDMYKSAYGYKPKF